MFDAARHVIVDDLDEQRMFAEWRTDDRLNAGMTGGRLSHRAGMSRSRCAPGHKNSGKITSFVAPAATHTSIEALIEGSANSK